MYSEFIEIGGLKLERKMSHLSVSAARPIEAKDTEDIFLPPVQSIDSERYFIEEDLPLNPVHLLCSLLHLQWHEHKNDANKGPTDQATNLYSRRFIKYCSQKVSISVN